MNPAQEHRDGATASPAVAACEVAALQIVTPWTPGQTVDWLADAERARLFAEMATGMANARYPWLMTLLEAAGAKLLLMPGHFVAEVPAGSGRFVPIEDMGLHLQMVPWQNVDEATQ